MSSVVEVATEKEIEERHARLTEALFAEIRAMIGDEAPTIDVFAYGSLIFKPMPGASNIRHCFVRGYKRRFHQASPDHRGTWASPGRVCTLLPGNEDDICHGCVFTLPSSEFFALAFREKAGYSLERVAVFVEGDEEAHQAIAFVGRLDNEFYAGDGSPHDASDSNVASIIATAIGPSGPNREYLYRLREALLPARDDHIESLHVHILAHDAALAAAAPPPSSLTSSPTQPL